MKLLIAGYFGCGNIGDEAILSSLISAAKKDHPCGTITVLSGSPDETSTTYNVTSVHKYSFPRVLQELKTCNAFILGGGGIMQDSTSIRSLLYYLLLISAARSFKKKVILLGQGIGPVRRKYLLKKALTNVDLIAVRDKRSFEELASIGAKPKKLVLTSDLAFLLGSPNKEKGKKLLDIEGVKKCRSRLIGVSVRPPVKGKYSAAKYKAIAAACDHLIKEKDSQVVFLIFKYPDDLNIANKIMGFMKYPSHVVLRRCTPHEMLDVISGLDGLIGMRLHSLIFSSIARVPSLALSYDPKVERFQTSIGGPSLDLNGMSENALISAAGKFIDDLGGRDMHKVEQFVKIAQDNIKFMNECLGDERISILGVGIDNLKMEDAVKKAEELLSSKDPGLIVTPNPEMIMASLKDVELREIINSAYLSVADGVGLMVAGRMLGRRFKQRIAGIDLMMELVKKGRRIFLFGGKEGVASDAAKNLNANVVGTFHGYSMNDQLVIDSIKKAKPDILFVGLGSPKQEKWAAKHLKELGVPLVMCVGGSLDVISGHVKRAPFIMRRIGIEWLWRLITEPKRGRRMLVIPAFILKILKKVQL
ncbi:MAG: polysaccharide pyruvyl transferase CsaB [bacterium]